MDASSAEAKIDQFSNGSSANSFAPKRSPPQTMRTKVQAQSQKRKESWSMSKFIRLTWQKLTPRSLQWIVSRAPSAKNQAHSHCAAQSRAPSGLRSCFAGAACSTKLLVLAGGRSRAPIARALRKAYFVGLPSRTCSRRIRFFAPNGTWTDGVVSDAGPRWPS
jgi:hypothetical protein